MFETFQHYFPKLTLSDDYNRKHLLLSANILQLDIFVAKSA